MSAIGDHVDCVFGAGKIVSIKGDLAGIALDKWTASGVTANEVYVKTASLKPYTKKVVDTKVVAVVPPAGAKTVKAVGVTAPGNKLEAITIQRRAVGPDDIGITVKYAGICHSDIHTARGEWGPLSYPAVVGHEIGGVIESVGEKVTKFKVGDIVGVGCFVDSCRTCGNCKVSLGQYCSTGAVYTYNSKFKYPHSPEFNAEGGNPTQGGYSQYIVVQEDYVMKIPTNLDLAAATPLLCAGITVYSPMKHYGLKRGQKLAVVGLGGLGHMAVKFGKAFGAHVTVISRSESKRDTALAMGADDFVSSADEKNLAAVSCAFDMIINTISAAHNMMAIIGTLGFEGTMVMVGAGPDPMPISFGALIGKRRKLGGSLIGGIKETQEMLNFCGQHNIVCEIEKVNADYVNTAYDRTVAADVKYRFVIDVDTI